MADGLVEFTDSNFDTEALKSDVPVMVDFWATWCGPCRAIAPVVAELAKEYAGKAKVGKLNVDEQEQVAQTYGITSIPTLLFFKGGYGLFKALGPPSEEGFVPVPLGEIRHLGQGWG